MFLASNLKYLRKSIGYSQNQVASLLKIDRSTYSYYELGKTTPSPKNLTILSELYHTSLDDMFYKNMSVMDSFIGLSSVVPQSEEERELLLLFRHFDHQTRESVLQLFRTHCEDISICLPSL